MVRVRAELRAVIESRVRARSAAGRLDSLRRMAKGDVVVDGLWKTFRIYHQRNSTLKQAMLRRRADVFDEFWALSDVSFEVPAGSTFGLIGANGAGKSTMLKVLSRILVPDKGAVRTEGRVSALLELGSGFHPELSGRENIFLNGTILGMTRERAHAALRRDRRVLRARSMRSTTRSRRTRPACRPGSDSPSRSRSSPTS